MNKYVNKLSLKYDPFASAEKSRTFFAGAERQELLHRLVEQAHYGAPLSIVCGILGSGKSTLAREFCNSFSDEAMCVPVHATLFMNKHQFLDALLEQLPIGASSPEPEEIVEDLVRFAEKLYLEAKTLVIIVDDAHELASEVFEIVDSLTNKASEGAVHVLMLGELQLSNMLQSSLGNSAIGNRLSGRMLEQEIEPLGNDEVLEYIRIKLADAGFMDEIPLDGAAIGEIINEANGIPGTVNVLITDALNNKLDTARVPVEQKSVVEIGAPYWATAAVLILALLLAVFFIPAKTPERADIASVNSDSSRTQIPVPIGTAVVAASNDPGPVTELTENSLQVIKAEDVETSVAEVGPDLGSTNESSSAGDEAVSLAVSPVETESSGPTQSGLASVFEQQLLAYAPENFTLQIMGSRSEDAVQRFIDSELSAFNRGYFEARHEGEPWFVVVSGQYTSRTAADRALADLPSNIRRLNPWIRNVGDVHAAINEARSASQQSQL